MDPPDNTLTTGVASTPAVVAASDATQGASWDLRRGRGQLERMLGVLAEAVTVHDRDGRLIFANRAALERMGIGTLREALATAPGELVARFEISDEHGVPLDPGDLPGRRVLQGEDPGSMLLRSVDRATGRLRWALVKATEFEDDQGCRFAVNVIEDVTDAKEQELRQRFLVRASEVLGSSLDYQETMQRVARLAVPELADWCAVEMIDGDELRQVAVAHVDPSKIAFAQELRERYPPTLDEPGGVGAVIRTGRPEFYPAIPDELLAASVRDEEHLGLLRDLELRSVMIVPMRSRGRVVGAITFVAAETARAFDDGDLAFVEDFAARAASAIDNARLYRERTETAQTLQRSLLPARLPQVPGWRIATLYRAADQASHIGGDFFDLFPTRHGFTVVIGDVTGKGITAATLTALTRYTARAGAMLGQSPAEILSLLNRVLLDQPTLSLVTAVIAQVTDTAGEPQTNIACAGHPLPLRYQSDALPVPLGQPGLLLGLDREAVWSQQTIAIQPGDTLLFYTDGVTDTPGHDDRFGEGRLHAMMAGCPSNPDALVRQIDHALRDFEHGKDGDDIAMLAAQRLPQP